MARCYGYRSDTNLIFQLPTQYFAPCPSGLGCCVIGDTCLSNNICHFTHGQPEGFYSGYYIGSCTDPTFTSPSCPRQCTSLLAPDVAYNYTSSEWACCGKDVNGIVSCNKPTSETFSAPAPSALSTILAVTSSSSSSSIQPSTSTPTTSTTTQPTPASQTPKPTSLSTGAKAGIGIGAGIGALLILALPAWLFTRHRRRRHPRDRSTAYGPVSGVIEADSHAVSHSLHEKDSRSRRFPQELAAS